MLSEQIIADNIALFERNRELECELAALKAALGRIDRIADRLHNEASALSELSETQPMDSGDASAMAITYGISCELKEAIKW